MCSIKSNKSYKVNLKWVCVSGVELFFYLTIYIIKSNNIIILYFTNSIENYFSMLKSRLQKLDGLTNSALKENITKVIREIPKEKYRNIINGFLYL